jgi:hypothetical protein
MKKVSHTDQRNAEPEEQLPLGEEGMGVPEASQDQLDKIMELAREQVRLKRLYDKQAEELAATKKLLDDNKNNKLPQAMGAVGMEQFILGGGASVAVEKILRASIPSPNSDRVENSEERNRAGIEYMDKRAPSLIKNKITVTTGKGEEKLFARVVAALTKLKVEPNVERNIHSGTLSKWVKQEEAAGRAVDDAILGVHRVTVAEVKLPEADKAKSKPKNG